MKNDFTNILIDFNLLKDEWEQKEKQLLDSDCYKNANPVEKVEMLYVFDCSQNDAITEAMKQSSLQVHRIKDAFHLLMNYCKSRSGDCSDCILCDAAKAYDDDSRCLLDNFQCLTNAQLDNQIEQNVRKLQNKLKNIGGDS